MAVLATQASIQEREGVNGFMRHRELCTDDVVRECICDGFLNKCGYGD